MYTAEQKQITLNNFSIILKIKCVSLSLHIINLPKYLLLFNMESEKNNLLFMIYSGSNYTFSTNFEKEMNE